MTEKTARPRLLCVDDEPEILAGFQLHLRRHFDVSVASSGAAGLDLLAKEPFAVVLSDMRMPQMNGATFLRHVRERAPQTVRMLLTGGTDLADAISAVNDGQIFRFLSKPCSPPDLLRALQAAAEQFRLVGAERVLLEQTLRGSIRVLTDLLALVQPAAFGRATRAQSLLTQVCQKLGVTDRWELEVAAMISQVGCVTLSDEAVKHIYEGAQLSPDERAMQARLPKLAEQLLAHIPRLEKVREILRNLGAAYANAEGKRNESVPFGSLLLRLVLDLDELEASKLPPGQALGLLRGRANLYDPALVEALGTVLGASGPAAVREVWLRDLAIGMVFAADVRTKTGLLLIARGHAVTQGLIERIRNSSLTVEEPLRVQSE